MSINCNNLAPFFISLGVPERRIKKNQSRITELQKHIFFYIVVLNVLFATQSREFGTYSFWRLDGGQNVATTRPPPM